MSTLQMFPIIVISNSESTLNEVRVVMPAAKQVITAGEGNTFDNKPAGYHEDPIYDVAYCIICKCNLCYNGEDSDSHQKLH